MTDTTAGFDHEPDALLAIDRALDPDERRQFLSYVKRAWRARTSPTCWR
jgi:hypothetical protein